MKAFKFKEFVVHHDKTAMKIGTDSVLLGAWCAVNSSVDSILDIGSGTGILSLMLAQRSNATTIDAIEIDENAHEQCVENFEQSSWSDRLFCYHGNFIDLADELSQDNETYDLIISNPPFYTDNFKSSDEARNKARFTSALSFENLLSGVAKLLSKQGTFAVVLPKKEQQYFTKIAENEKLFCNRICNVKGNNTSDVKRCLLEFSFTQTPIHTEELIIEIERHTYTKAYKELTQDFYINF